MLSLFPSLDKFSPLLDKVTERVVKQRSPRQYHQVLLGREMIAGHFTGNIEAMHLSWLYKIHTESINKRICMMKRSTYENWVGKAF